MDSTASECWIPSIAMQEAVSGKVEVEYERSRALDKTLNETHFEIARRFGAPQSAMMASTFR